MRKATDKANQLPDISTYVLQFINDNHINRPKMLKNIGWKDPKFTKLLKRLNWTVRHLLELSRGLGTNLFAFYVPSSGELMLPASEVEKALKRIESLETQLAKAKEENKILQAKLDTAMEIKG